MKSARSFFIALMLMLSGMSAALSLSAQSTDGARSARGAFNIIPYPSSLLPGDGLFMVSSQTTLVSSSPLFRNETTFLQELFRGSMGAGALQLNAALKQNKGALTNAILLKYDPSIPSEEGYALSVNPKRVILKARTAVGMFHAMETLRQLMPADVETGAAGSGTANGQGSARSLSIPAVEITDQPVFAWRGMMLDVSRHFFSVAYVKRVVDMMALYKLNRLHLHLTDDQGWRIEIKKYPLLTSVSGWRTYNLQDSEVIQLAKTMDNPDFNLEPSHIRVRDGKTEYGGFYTQEQMKDLIRYAASRHIEVVPEIDMPGHMMAAVLLYPWLTCDGKLGANGMAGGFSSPICPCKDSAMQFAKDVLSEIFKVFPSKYVHIGGDEVEKRAWANSPLCRQFMADHHIKTLELLQSYFNDRLQEFFHAHGKILMGWDEIVDGGINSSAAVMFWRPWAKEAPLKATSNGNKVVMSPDGPLYFDWWPNKNTLPDVYHYDPRDPKYGMNDAQKKNIIGVQGNLWTEHVPSDNRVDYMVMPRLTALAELGWTYKDLYESYLIRLNGQYDRLDRLNIRYRLPDLPDMAENHVFTDSSSFFVASPSPAFPIRYTTDGSNPVASSPVLSQPLTINHSLKIKLAAFTAGGRRGDLYSVGFDRQTYAHPVAVDNLKTGLECRLYKGHFHFTTQIKPESDSVMQLSQAEVPAGITAPEFGLKFTGYIDIPEIGIYSFFLTSNDGSVLHIADRLVVNNDGEHGDQEKSGQVALEKGLHPFELDFTEAGGGYMLNLKYSKGDGQPQAIPAEWFKSK